MKAQAGQGIWEDGMRHVVLRIAFVLIAVLVASAPVWAQWATPTIDGSIAPGEYGNNNSLSNAGNTGQTWNMTWDATNLYVGIENANLAEGAVIYVTANPQNPPTCCSNTDGGLTGFQYDFTNFSSLPFRAKFVTYVKDGYREYRNFDATTGFWGVQTPFYGSYVSNSGTLTREVAIPWSGITSGGGIPSSFVFFGYLTSSGGFVYGQVPTDNNISEFIGTSATATNYYSIVNTGNGTSTPPFSNEQPGPPAQQLSTLMSTIISFGLPLGTTTSLNAKVNAALVALNGNDTATACSNLADLISAVQAQSGKRLTVAQANSIISAATQVRSQLGCS
jgi:hypothetical protein